MGDGGAHLLLRGGIKVAVGAAGDGDAPAPEPVDRVPQFLAPDGEGPLQFPAGSGAALAQMVLPQIFGQLFILHDSSFPGPFFRKRAQAGTPREPSEAGPVGRGEAAE